MKEDDLDVVLDQISSGQVREKNDGIKRAFSDTLSDSDFHQIFESLFHFVKKEKAAYLRTSKSNPRNASADRLAAAASALRAAIRISVPRIRQKTLNAVIDHILDCLPGASGTPYCPPLRTDYLKGLRHILQHRPHLEHLRDGKITGLIELCLSGLTDIADDQSTDTSSQQQVSVNGSMISSTQISRSIQSTPLRISQKADIARSGSELITDTDEIVISLEALSTVSRSTLLSMSEEIFNCLLVFLSSAAVSQMAQLAAFGTINNLLKNAMTEKINLAVEMLEACLPLIARFWQGPKPSSLRDEMLLTLLLGIGLLRGESVPEAKDDHLQAIENLIESFQVEYSRRKKEDVLQIDDLTFFCTEKVPKLDLFGMAPCCNNSRSISKWMFSSLLAALIAILDSAQSTSTRGKEAEGSEKRRRMTRALDDLFRGAVTHGGFERVRALQLVPHMFLVSKRTASLFADRFDEFLNGALDDNAFISSCFVYHQSLPDAPKFEKSWTQVWNVAARNIATPASSRAACFLLTTLLRSRVLDSYEAYDLTQKTLLSNGPSSLPSSLTDSSMALYQSVVQQHLQLNNDIEDNAATIVVQWVNATWSTGSLSDRTQLRHMAANIAPAAILNLLSACTSRQSCFFMTSQITIESKLLKAWLSLEHERELTDYLVLKDDTDPRECSSGSMPNTKSLVDEKKTEQLDLVALQMMLSKLKQVVEAWNELQNERTIKPSEHDVQVIVSLWAVARICVTVWAPSLSILCADIMKESENIWREVNAFIAQVDSKAVFPYGVSLISSLSVNTTSESLVGSLANAIQPFVSPAFDLLNQQRSAETANEQSDDSSQTDPMEAEKSFTLQRSSQTNNHKSSSTFTGEHVSDSLELYFSITAISAQLKVSHVLVNASEGDSSDNTARTIDFFSSLGPHELVDMRNAILKFLSTTNFARNEACLLLEYFGETLLQPYSFERCESALCFCVEVLTTMTSLWMSDFEDDLSETAFTLYQWFIEDTMNSSFASPRLLQCITLLLQKVMEINPAFSSRPSGPSPRTCLFRLLSHTSNTVKYKAGKAIPQLFGQFVLTEHSAMFSDVIKSLPDVSLNTEGFAFRLDLLSRLGQQWHTVRHAAISRMFEASTADARAVPYAKYCLRVMAEKLKLKNLHDLFRLFAPQLLDSLLDYGTIASIPYAAFEYDSLQDLLTDVLDEIVAQVAMRGSEKHLQTLSEELQIQLPELLSLTFPKVEVYCLARDICLPPSQETHGKSTETIMRRRLGSEYADSLTRRDFAEIVFGLIFAMDQEQHVEKAFAKHSGYTNARNVFNAINRFGSSGAPIYSLNRPSFRAKYILDELEFLSKRVARDTSSLWNPNMTVFVVRRLVDCLHPALGPFYACTTLRKIKIVICLAGSTVCHGYPLEQLLHAVRPFLTDFYSSPDAIALFKYLLTEGKSHLIQNPSFLSGLAILTFMALRNFLLSPQDSTTQESLFKEVVSTAESFRQWFVQYLENCSPAISPDVQNLFGQIVRVASKVKTNGSAIEGTCEGTLLATLLEDQSSSTPLLSQPTFDSAIENLCASFSRPTAFRDDIVNTDATAFKYAPVLWQVVNRTKIEGSFRFWVAHILGKSYASSGQINDFLIDEHSHELFEARPSYGTVHLSSNVAIIQKFKSLLSSENQRTVGIAERTLHTIVGQAAERGDPEPYAQILGSILLTALSWTPLQSPQVKLRHPVSLIVNHASCWDSRTNVEQWASQFSLNLAIKSAQDPIISGLSSILYELPEIATGILPYLVHSVLSSSKNSNPDLGPFISQTFREALQERAEKCRPHLRLILSTVFYLRKQPFPREATIVDREKWIELDASELAAAAVMCQMYKSALMVLELQTPQHSRSSRRSSLPKIVLPPGLLQQIFENLEDPDYFYGLQQDTSISSIIKKLDYEGSGLKALSFQSAQFDSNARLNSNQESSPAISGVLRSLSLAGFNGIASTLHRSSMSSGSTVSRANPATASLNLHEWDIPIPASDSSHAALLKALSSINRARDDSVVPLVLDESLGMVFDTIAEKGALGKTLHSALSSLAALSELRDIWSCCGKSEIEDYMTTLGSRNDKTRIESFDRISSLLTAREAMFSSLRIQPHLQKKMGLTEREAYSLEVKATRETLRTSRRLEASQAALNSAIYLSRLVAPSANVGLDIEAVSSFDLAKVLWDQEEKTTSVQILQDLCERNDLHKQVIPISRAQLLADLAHQSSEARLEDPQDHIERYLLPAVKELKGDLKGPVAGRVYHEFASYCDGRLQNPDYIEDFERAKKLRFRKEQEVNDYEKAIKEADAKQKDTLKYHLGKAKLWYKLDDQEYQRKKKIRENLIHRSLENYLLTLLACDDYDTDVLRFCALWLNESHSENANAVVARRINEIPSRKFAPLMNQLSSRLQNTKDTFQALLFDLIVRICRDHPFHGMYQIFATSKAKHGREDTAISRHAAANRIAESLHKDGRTSSLWVTVHNASSASIKFANDRLDDDKKRGKFPIRSLQSGQKLEAETLHAKAKLPPPTLRIELRADCDYSSVPGIAKYDSNFAIASGVSAPKIVTLVGSDGKRYRQLFKGGNDDLRQDAIMEQVFEQVSNLLKEHRETRRRKLGIRTYKVLPLHTNAGIIEFVQNTIPLHDFLLPAHQRYHPKDMKPSACRNAVAEVDKRPTEHRIHVFRRVLEKFHPVMRYFFFERFPNPDDWFVKRLAYSRTTAAISILGHVLGLGDRHGHNILLDETSGEVVHIDLGVAFETGRVLPVPEVVPFRLTRDLVDGMGITKTEGVFRRCCNFTLEALRKESYSIMTVLDVLRYDPLYSWSLSPLRMKRMQETDKNANAAADKEEAEDKKSTARSTATRSSDAAAAAAAADEPAKKQDPNEPSEADRALTVVAKKLGKSLSVEATVNELIQQATDERNLAVLYCGELLSPLHSLLFPCYVAVSDLM
ncbi:MAG: hypothetical protein Q9160_007191 [Pyrenula sp. 1 TL-2023]